MASYYFTISSLIACPLAAGSLMLIGIWNANENSMAGGISTLAASFVLIALCARLVHIV